MTQQAVALSYPSFAPCPLTCPRSTVVRCMRSQPWDLGIPSWLARAAEAQTSSAGLWRLIHQPLPSDTDDTRRVPQKSREKNGTGSVSLQLRRQTVVSSSLLHHAHAIHQRLDAFTTELRHAVDWIVGLANLVDLDDLPINLVLHPQGLRFKPMDSSIRTCSYSQHHAASRVPYSTLRKRPQHPGCCISRSSSA